MRCVPVISTDAYGRASRHGNARVSCATRDCSQWTGLDLPAPDARSGTLERRGALPLSAETAEAPDGATDMATLSLGKEDYFGKLDTTARAFGP